jgi:low affinity Fe/Cu permease
MDTDDRPARAARSRDTRSRFDRFVEVAQAIVSRPEAFTVVALVIILWAASYPLFHHIAEWHAVIHSAASITSLLLLVLLENAGRRADQAAQEKLNVMSEALVALLDERADAHAGDEDARGPLTERAQALRTAVGLEDRH